MDSNIFWSNDPKVLFQTNKLKNFFPSANYAMVENLNVVVRMFFYLSIVLVLYSRNPQYLLLPLGAMLVTYLLFHYYPNKEELFYAEPVNQCELTLPEKRISVNRRKDFVERKCVTPTTENPFMNFNYITDNYHRPPACKAFLYDDPQSQELKEKIEEKFDERLYKSVTDIYSKRNSQREFYTVAYNQIPDQGSFSRWLFGQGSTCKEDGLKCSSYSGSLL